MLMLMNGRRDKGQKGFVAIFTVLVIMSVLTLITLGFTRVVQNSARRALDDQLNQQAYYAAETGVNRAWELINSGALAANKDNCQDGLTAYDYAIDADANIEISCILVDRTPWELVGETGLGMPFIMPIDPDGAGTPSTLEFEWDVLTTVDPTRNNAALVPTTTVTGTPVGPQFLPADEWGARISPIRIDLLRYPTSDTTGASIRRDTAVGNTYTFYLYPTTQAGIAAGTTISSDTTQGRVMPVHCDSVTSLANRCRISLRLGGSAAGSNRYYLRVSSYYHNSTIEVRARDGGGNQQRLENAQAVIDSTGRVSDVSRRIQVHVPIYRENSSFIGLSNNFSLLTGNSICKRLIALPYANATQHSYVDTGDGASSDPACNMGN